jgi:hypothetical protein
MAKAWVCGLVAAWGMVSAGAEVISRPDTADQGDARPFAIVDKRQATLSVHAADGRLLGRAPVLLGLTPGDVEPASARGKDPSALGVQERVTPAGRFEAQPGRNLTGERIVWFDYRANLAIHRLRPAPASQQRPERLASARLQDRRITLGCVAVDPAFFDSVVLPTLGGGPSLVYILPEREPVLAGAAAVTRAAVP